MKTDLQLPFSIEDVELCFDPEVAASHKERAREILKNLLPERFFEPLSQEQLLKRRKIYLNENLPLVGWRCLKAVPSSLTVTLLTKQRQNASLFLYDMISRWLVPHKNLNVELFFSLDFTFSKVSEEKYSVMELQVQLSSENELEEVLNNMRSIETEVRLGITSDYHAKRILEFKGLSADRKTALIQEKIGSLIQSRSKDFGRGIFSQMQHFLVTCRDEFKAIRDHNHISRIISNLHQIRKLLQEKVSLFPGKRHLFLKFMKTKLNLLHTQKHVLGVLVGMNFLKEHEIFEKEHLVQAIKNYIPEIKLVENSFFSESQENSIQALYLEIEKESSGEFSFEEIQNLRFVLPQYLKDHVEHLVHPVFKPRNEEEIVKNIVLLSQELRFVHDIPQVIISFDNQTPSELHYTVMFLRILKPRDPALKDIFEHCPAKVKFVLERVKRLSLFRKKYFKEANVFKVVLPTREYLRADHSIDLARARKKILDELCRIFGEVRDYNGGMILKQGEAFDILKESLGEIATQNERLLEKFFYAIFPGEMATTVRTEYLKSLFMMLFNATKSLSDRPKGIVSFKREAKTVYFLCPVEQGEMKKKILGNMENLIIFSSECLSCDVRFGDADYLGYIFFEDDAEKQGQLIANVNQAFAER